jgi:hypothetical protein
MSAKPITVWDGVKIVCGIFIVLPAISLVISILFLMLALVSSCAKARKTRELPAIEQNMRTD